MVNYKDLLSYNIKKLRKRLGHTQEKFAELANISVDGLRKIEKGKYAPQPETIDKICSAFNITPFELLLPDIENDNNLIHEINCKLKLCNPDKLRRISQVINLIN